MIGPLPNHLTYKEVELAVWKIGDIQRLYLQWNNKFKVALLPLGTLLPCTRQTKIDFGTCAGWIS